MDRDNKYIHYCWFGDGKISKLTKKCIKSWKKYLPDYKIICWNEKNININECVFLKEAYQKKKWAFVADYVRAKVLYEYGGIYLDTDMLIKKDIKSLLKNKTFLGVEDSDMVAVGVWWEKKPGGYLTKRMLEYYRSQEHFEEENIYKIAIPQIITRELQKLGFKHNFNAIQLLKENICIYPREYFYPLSYDYKNNIFTEKTCMVHYFDASWVPKNEKRSVRIIRLLGRKNTDLLLKIIKKTKQVLKFYLNVIKRTISIVLYPIRYFIRKHRYLKKNKEQFLVFAKKISEVHGNYVTFCRHDWLGIKSATTSLFKNIIEINGEMSDIDRFDLLVNAINKKKIRLVIFSAFSTGWEIFATKIKQSNPDIIIKVIWHGGNASNIADYDMDRFNCIFQLLNEGIINSIAFVKKSMYAQYKQLGYNVEFLANTFQMNSKTKSVAMKKKKKEPLRVGLYAAGDRWIKNFYNQLSAISIIDEEVIADVIPLTDKAKNYAKILKIDIQGSHNSISHEQMLERIKNNDIVLYATFAECAPMLPLECLEQEVLCITGANHHYWEGTELEKYLIEPKADNPVAIAERIKLCLSNREKILKLYKNWKKTYDKECQKLVREFLDYNK